MYKLLIFIFTISHFQILAQQANTQILIVGTYHMDNPGLDVYNMVADDVTAEKRQREIVEFVNLLARFKPTMICLEYPVQQQASLQQNYQSYLDGNYALSKSETDQLGLRLAKQLGHKEVYAIDSKAPFNMDTVIKTAEKYGITSFLQLLSTMPAFIEAETKLILESTIHEIYQHLNSEAYVRMSHDWYLRMVAVGGDDNFAGADLMADWYKRNLRIYRNLLLLEPSKEDKVLVLIGAGHTKILQDLVEDSSRFELIKLSDLE